MKIMELRTKRPSLLWIWGPNSIMVVYMDPKPYGTLKGTLKGTLERTLKGTLKGTQFGYMDPLGSLQVFEVF